MPTAPGAQESGHRQTISCSSGLLASLPAAAGGWVRHRGRALGAAGPASARMGRLQLPLSARKLVLARVSGRLLTLSGSGSG